MPYISPQLDQLMAERDRLKEEAAQTSLQEDYDLYKKKRNEVSTLLKNAEANHYGNKFNDVNVQSKDVWKTAYEVLGKCRSAFPSQILHAGRLISNPTEIATEVNNFFIDKIRLLKEEFESDPNEDPTSELKKYLSKKTVPKEGFELKELNNADMRKLMKTLKGKKSLGLDWICGYSPKMVSGCLSDELKAIINISIKKKQFVTQWKCSKVLTGWKIKVHDLN